MVRALTEMILVKMRPLPSDDLVRIAPMTPDGKRRALAGMLAGRAAFSYKPLRKCLADLLNTQHRLLPVDDAPLEKVLAEIARAAKRGVECETNLELAELLYTHLREEEFVATHETFRPIPLGVGISMGFCADAVLTRERDLIVPAFNFRRSPLAGAGLRFALSVMHQQSRELNEDLRTARLEVVQFPQPKGAKRFVSTASAPGVSLFPYEDLTRMASETYAIWNELQEERADKAQRTGTDDAEWWG